MTVYTFDEDIVSDLHKDARGYRPRDVWWTYWSNCSDAEKQREWDGLYRELSETANRERHEQNMALITLHQRIQGVMLLGAKDEVQALKWIIEAEEFSDHDLQYGPSYFCYHFGLNYSAEKELPIQEAINEMLVEVV
jgi:hypothetical protein